MTQGAVRIRECLTEALHLRLNCCESLLAHCSEVFAATFTDKGVLRDVDAVERSPPDAADSFNFREHAYRVVGVKPGVTGLIGPEVSLQLRES